MRKIIRQRWIKVALVIITFVMVSTVTYSLNQQYIRSCTDMITVVVAAQKIPAFSAVKRDMVVLAKKPRIAVPPDAITEPDIFLKQEKYYTGELGFGSADIIRLDRLTNIKHLPAVDLAMLPNENKMLVSVNTNLVKSCANFVVPGALVDAVVFIKSETIDEDDKIISPLEDPYLANLLVVDKKNSESGFPHETGREAIPAVITLMLDRANVETAKALVRYNETGSIYLLPVGLQSEVYLASVN